MTPPPSRFRPSQARNKHSRSLARSLAHSRLAAYAHTIRSILHQQHSFFTRRADDERGIGPTTHRPIPALVSHPPFPPCPPPAHPSIQKTSTRARVRAPKQRRVRPYKKLCVDTCALPPLPLSTPARTPRMRVHSMDRSIPTLSPAHTNTPRLRARHASYQASARPSAPPSAKNRSVPRRPPQQSAGWRRRRAQRPSAFGAGHRERKRGWRRRTCLVHPRARAAGASSRSTRPRVSCCAPSQSRARPTTLLGGFDAHALPPRASPLTSQSRPIGDGRRARF